MKKITKKVFVREVRQLKSYQDYKTKFVNLKIFQHPEE